MARHDSTYERRVHFASRLRAAMARKGWTQTQTAKAAAAFLTPGEKLGRSHLSQYVTGRALPGPRYRSALSRALELSEAELMGPALGEEATAPASLTIDDQPLRSGDQAASGEEASPEREAVEVRDAGDGGAWLHIDQRIPWSTALEILKLLKGGDPEKR